MSRAVAFLRSVNVGGRGRLPMAELRAVAASLGLRDVQTYVQSGNVIFDAPPGLDVGPRLKAALAEAAGLSTSVLVRTTGELDAIAGANPFLPRITDFVQLHVVFLADAPSADRIAQLDPDRSPRDTFVVHGREIYVHYPNGAGRSKLTLDYFERRLRTSGTARNWNTVTKVQALLAAAD